MSTEQKNKPEQHSSIHFRDFWEINEQHVASSYRKLRNRIGQSPHEIGHVVNWWKIAAVAASVALVVVCGLYWFALTHPATLPAEVVYVTNSPSQITLPDGTKVWLSARSQLRYRQTFTSKTRDVVLNGEAYFEVTHNSEQPFRVKIGDHQKVEVLGTCFNVRAYSEETEIITALVEGSVKLVDCKTHTSVVLKPGQQGHYIRTTGLTTVDDVNLDLLMSWKTGKYVFNNQTFGEIARTLEKGFNVTIRIENEKLKNKPYTMRFENGESLEKILDLRLIIILECYSKIGG